MPYKIQKGATLAEMLIVLAIAAILFVMTYEVFVNYNRGQALEKSAAVIAAILNEARSKTLAGRGAAQYGIHFVADGVTFFIGATYNPSDPNNKTEKINSLIEISSINLNGNGNDVIFEKLTGATNQSGTIVIRNKNNLAQTMIITIYPTGLIEAK
ncbi:MAG TPA: prepilin-type N-terminal cleavage/methylation domain-containing protein [Candidatus Paceibacterota bacterium]